MSAFTRYAEARGSIAEGAAAVYDFLDDQANLSAHMSKSSGMMLGSSMNIRMEADHTRNVGSRFGFTGHVLGIPLAVEEIVTGREPPMEKTWETTSEPRLWVIGRYAMGFELTAQGKAQSDLRVYIHYDLPAQGVARVLGHLFGRFYAKWCTHLMVSDAQKHFAGQPGEGLKTANA